MSTGYDANQVRQGDHVYWPDYGNGVIKGIAANRMVIEWEKEGKLWHETSFARHLVLVARSS